MGKIGFGITDTLFVPIQLGAGVIMIVVIIVMTIKKSEAAGAKWLTRIAALVMIISLAAGWNYGFYNNIDDFNRNSSVYKRLQTSVQRAGNKIQDDDFFRVDAKEGLQQRAVVKYPPNENAWWRTNTLYIYNSRVPSSLLEFNKAVGNNYGYSRRVAVLSNGNRMGLDFLFGVKYYLGNDSREEDYDSNSFTDPYYREPDNYAGYGFVKAYDIDGVSVFKSKYDAGLGFVYDKVISYSEFMKLSRLEREQALLQAAVIPDNELSDVSDIQEVKATDIDLDVKEIPFKIVGTENLTISGNTIKVGDDGGYITIKPEDHSNCQLVVSFDNLRKTSGSASFDVTSEDGRHFVTACNERSRQSITGIVDFDLNMGYYESRSGEIKVGLTSGGTYTFDKFYVSAMSTANYDEYAAKCSENRLKVTEYDDSHVKGYVDSAGGVLFLSIPANDNWDIYIDGSKVERLEKIAITFFGAKIGAGHHEIELKYQNKLMYLGAIISAVGLVLFLIIVIVVAVRRRRERRELNPDQNQDQAQGL